VPEPASFFDHAPSFPDPCFPPPSPPGLHPMAETKRTKAKIRTKFPFVGGDHAGEGRPVFFGYDAIRGERGFWFRIQSGGKGLLRGSGRGRCAPPFQWSPARASGPRRRYCQIRSAPNRGGRLWGPVFFIMIQSGGKGTFGLRLNPQKGPLRSSAKRNENERNRHKNERKRTKSERKRTKSERKRTKSERKRNENFDL